MDLDPNGHVTHGRLVEWLLEALPFGFLDRHLLADAEVHYLREANYGEAIESAAVDGDRPGTFRHRLTRLGDGAELCRAHTRWKKTDQG